MSLLKLESRTSPAAPPKERAAAASSPGAYVGAGAAGGVIATLLVVALVMGVAKGGWSWPGGTPAPIAEAGLRVLVLEESANRKPVTMMVLRNPEVESYLNGKCVKGPDGKTPEWRVLDKDDGQLPRLSKLWQDAHARAKKDAGDNLPWLIVSNGRTGASLPFPATKEGMLTTLRKYGGD